MRKSTKHSMSPSGQSMSVSSNNPVSTPPSYVLIILHYYYQNGQKSHIAYMQQERQNITLYIEYKRVGER